MTYTDILHLLTVLGLLCALSACFPAMTKPIPHVAYKGKPPTVKAGYNKLNTQRWGKALWSTADASQAGKDAYRTGQTLTGKSIPGREPTKSLNPNHRRPQMVKPPKTPKMNMKKTPKAKVVGGTTSAKGPMKGKTPSRTPMTPTSSTFAE